MEYSTSKINMLQILEHKKIFAASYELLKLLLFCFLPCYFLLWAWLTHDVMGGTAIMATASEEEGFDGETTTDESFDEENIPYNFEPILPDTSSERDSSPEEDEEIDKDRLSNTDWLVHTFLRFLCRIVSLGACVDVV